MREGVKIGEPSTFRMDGTIEYEDCYISALAIEPCKAAKNARPQSILILEPKGKRLVPAGEWLCRMEYRATPDSNGNPRPWLRIYWPDPTIGDNMEHGAHVGNWARDSEGCPLVGMAMETDGESMMLLRSAEAMRVIADALPEVDGQPWPLGMWGRWVVTDGRQKRRPQRFWV